MKLEETGRSGKKQEEMGRNGKKWEETGRNGKKRQETRRNRKTILRQSSYSPQIVLRQASDRPLIILRLSSDSPQIVLRQSSDSHQIILKKSSESPQVILSMWDDLSIFKGQSNIKTVKSVTNDKQTNNHMIIEPSRFSNQWLDWALRTFYCFSDFWIKTVRPRLALGLTLNIFT